MNNFSSKDSMRFNRTTPVDSGWYPSTTSRFSGFSDGTSLWPFLMGNMMMNHEFCFFFTAAGFFRLERPSLDFHQIAMLQLAKCW